MRRILCAVIVLLLSASQISASNFGAEGVAEPVRPRVLEDHLDAEAPSTALPWDEPRAIYWCGNNNNQAAEDCFWYAMDWWGCEDPVDLLNPYCWGIAFGTCLGCGGIFDNSNNNG